ncbi:hypothetical protein [Paenibacillus ginsengarvi]|uniref:Lipoprotein n=1 Tax=Paenibacillus ginsengarvi TaxID=400777 RepID=A0A3B0BFW5_9BACL|nr:hypothetical protein [Paenibacillus ginsengarvi]RKN71199.1 hypothetical protein D7M11_29330 [Paenibacillus ginsengarvi]
MKKANWTAAAAAVLVVLSISGCRQGDYRMQQQPVRTEDTEDTRGMRKGEHMEDRVNTNLPKGSSVPETKPVLPKTNPSGISDGGAPYTTEEGGGTQLQEMGRPAR